MSKPDKKRTPQEELTSLHTTAAWDLEGDLAAEMVAGIDRYLMRAIEASVASRSRRWKRNFSSHKAYLQSIQANRRRFRRIIGASDPRVEAEMEVVQSVHSDERSALRGHDTSPSCAVGEGTGYRVYAVRWNALKGVDGEGLLLLPDRSPLADVVALPDCDWTPEMLTGLAHGVPEDAQFARRLAENGCRVLVPVLIDRRDTYSVIPGIAMTNQPHREFLYRAAFEMGRHLIGFEVQKVLAAVDWFRGVKREDVKREGVRREDVKREGVKREYGRRPLGVMGYGEGGLVALYAAAADPRIDVAAVSGYLQPRERVWGEPIYRNVFALLHEFGDAEIASLVAPRPLIVEACRFPEVSGPPSPTPQRSGAAPGVLTTPSADTVAAEVERARQLTSALEPPQQVVLVKTGDGLGLPGSNETLSALMKALGVKRRLSPSVGRPKNLRGSFDTEARIKRQFDQLVEYTQFLMREGEFTRTDFWKKADASTTDTWERSCRRYRKYLWEEVIGRLPKPTKSLNPRARLVYDEPAYRGFEVVLDVYRDIFAYGILLVPKDLKGNEQRPVVVCQHGLEGRPQDVANPKEDNEYYHQFACRLAERGFITYSPQNPYIGMDDFRVLQRKANPLKLSLFSFIVRQHEQTLKWLSSLPFIDPKRIGFYGLSYGGKTAMRVPALLEQYCLSICSADYNEWIWKNVSTRHVYSYMRSGEYEMCEFDLGNTFNYAEMSWLICPRPFMVERGHFDGVAPDEWVAYEYAKTRRRYDLLGLGDRTELEVFIGPHCINGVGTFEFLHKHLNWPKCRE